jgi:hypothetical protein
MMFSTICELRDLRLAGQSTIGLPFAVGFFGFLIFVLLRGLTDRSRLTCRFPYGQLSC